LFQGGDGFFIQEIAVDIRVREMPEDKFKIEDGEGP
jgi:hypothetical protein